MNTIKKVKCSERLCNWRGNNGEFLQAKNPLDDDDIIVCPDCKNIDTIVQVCDEPDCWNHSTCGTPTPAGYRLTCEKHRPRSNKMPEIDKCNECGANVHHYHGNGGTRIVCAKKCQGYKVIASRSSTEKDFKKGDLYEYIE